MEPAPEGHHRLSGTRTSVVRSTVAEAAAYGAAVDLARLHVYYWLGSVHAILYGLMTGDRQTVADGVAGLRSRLAPH